ncbi:MAG TPA: GNAT family N-acetyltransferase [Candidatus Acidoferrum sp.]|nr:GNAT family N-acetyltransferase [Candidatus Acidoferrum sp.]
MDSTKLPKVLISKAAPKQADNLRTFLLRANIGADAVPAVREFWTATFQKRIVGCAAIQRVGLYGIIHSIAVEKACRRQGIGTKLLKHCLREARTDRLQLVALTTMFWNIAFFKRAGFETTSRKRLPLELQGHPDFFSPRFRYTTPMILVLRRTKALTHSRRR